MTLMVLVKFNHIKEIFMTWISRNRIKLINAIAFTAMVVVNALAVLLPINGVTPGQVSDSYPNLFAPAGFTFSIWSVIYLLLLFFTLFQLRNESEAVEKIGYAFVVSCLSNIAWIFSWHYKVIGLSLFFIIVLFISLAKIFLEIKKFDLSRKEKILVELPFSIYFGWITVAVIANVTTWLVSMESVNLGLSEFFWTNVVLTIGLLITFSVIILKNAPSFGLSVIWAYAGILAKHVSPDGFGKAYLSVMTTAGTCLALLVIVVFSMFFYLRKEWIDAPVFVKA